MSSAACDYSGGDTPKPPPPDNLTAEVEGADVRLRWNATAPDEYRLERSDFVNGSFNETARVPGDTEEYLDADVLFGETYFYRVRGYDEDYPDPFSDYSNEVEITVE